MTAVPLVAAPAFAAGGAYGDWTLPAPTGSLSFPGVGLPNAVVTTDSTSPPVASGQSAFLNPSTPFGQAYGGSRGRPYLALRTAAGATPSTTTITFDTAPPAGTWGFALGDVDADHVHICATGPDGVDLTPAELGFQGAFNY
ncbi:hypothetical protein [Streptodolium elevatio]